MKTAVYGSFVMGLMLATGCNQGKPGGPGATNDSSSIQQADSTFNLSVPMLSSSIKQGGKMDAVVSIKRAKNFDEDVALKFTDLPAGITTEPAAPAIRHGDDSAKFQFVSTDASVLGDYKVKITGHPSKGSDAQVDFKLTVEAMDSFTLNMPRGTTSIKQGEVVTLAVGINRDEEFDEDVALTFSELPQGVTIEPAAPIIKKGVEETQVTLTSSADASLGNFEIKVTGHPTKGVDASSGLKLTIAKG